jgi:hypothetical protein
MGLARVPRALVTVFSDRGYAALSSVLAVVSFLAYVSVPVLLIPGNSYQFFLAITPPLELAGMALTSIAMGIVFSMQIYSWRNSIPVARNAGAGLAGFLGGSMSAIFSTASCASCVSAIFSFIGFGGVVFLMEHRTEFSLLTMGIVLLSLYLTSEKIEGNCPSCALTETEKHREGREKDETGE